MSTSDMSNLIQLITAILWVVNTILTNHNGQAISRLRKTVEQNGAAENSEN